jgi:hypothetical protein
VPVVGSFIIGFFSLDFSKKIRNIMRSAAVPVKIKATSTEKSRLTAAIDLVINGVTEIPKYAIAKIKEASIPLPLTYKVLPDETIIGYIAEKPSPARLIVIYIKVLEFDNTKSTVESKAKPDIVSKIVLNFTFCKIELIINLPITIKVWKKVRPRAADWISRPLASLR